MSVSYYSAIFHWFLDGALVGLSAKWFSNSSSISVTIFLPLALEIFLRIANLQIWNFSSIPRFAAHRN